jgi:hypothetical protein
MAGSIKNEASFFITTDARSRQSREDLDGAPSETRTRDPLIKSNVRDHKRTHQEAKLIDVEPEFLGGVTLVSRYLQ